MIISNDTNIETEYNHCVEWCKKYMFDTWTIAPR